MALAAASVFEVRTAGNDTNGGGFVTGAAGTDYSQQDAKNTVGADISTTDAVAAGTTTITSATANFGTTIVGNIIYLQGGTGALAAGWYQVTARASTVSITVDRTVATGTGITMNIGGALASPGMAGGVGLVAGNVVHVKAGTYSITSTTANVTGGRVSTSVRTQWRGYNSARNDLGTAPVFLASGIATTTIFTSGAAESTLINLTVDGASLTSIRGFSIDIRATLYKCTAKNCTNSGLFAGAAGVLFEFCAATGCTTAGAGFNTISATLFRCEAYANTVPGFLQNSGTIAYGHCIAYNNTGATTDGFSFMGQGSAWNCVSYANGRDGFRVAAGTVVFENSIAEANTGYGFDNPSLNNISLLWCAAYNNTAGATFGTFVLNLGFVTGTSSFFTNAATADFSLNTTAGGGASARAAGVPGVFPAGPSIGYLDIGAVQHGDPAQSSSGGQSISIFGGP